MKVHDRIRELRIKSGYTQEYMAEKLGMRHNNYGKIERGITHLTIKRLEEIANILNVEKSELINESASELTILQNTLQSFEEKYNLLLQINQMQKEEIVKLREENEYFRERAQFASELDIFLNRLIKIKRNGGPAMDVIKNIPDILLNKPVQFWNKEEKAIIDEERLILTYYFMRFDANDKDVFMELEFIKNKEEKSPYDKYIISAYEDWLKWKKEKGESK